MSSLDVSNLAPVKLGSSPLSQCKVAIPKESGGYRLDEIQENQVNVLQQQPAEGIMVPRV